MSDVLRGTCLGRTRGGAQCPRPPLEGSAYCDRHCPERARERGRNGRAKQLDAQRAARAAEAAALRVATLAELQATLAAATQQAYLAGDWAVVITAVRVGAELLQVGTQEERLAAVVDLLCARFPDARAKLGGLPS